jgi:PAS domain S-box-containing protein
MKVLIVDDKEENRYLLEALLKGNGHDVEAVGNGAEAFERIEAGGIELIISDILMPVMDGFQLCRKVKTDVALRHIPFIIYTATYTGPQDQEFAIKIGADRFIQKPCEPDVFMEAVRDVTAVAGRSKIASTPAPVDEEEMLKLYSERLVRKLEQKMLELEREVQTRREAEEALRASEQKYRLLADNTLEVIWALDLDLVFTYVNPAIQSVTGHTPEEWIGSRLSEHCDEENFAKLAQVIADEKAKGPKSSGVILEAVLLNKKREPIPFEIHGKVNYDEKGEPVALQGIARDISERKRAEMALKESEKKYRELYDFLPIPVYEMDFESNITSANRTIYETFRGTEEDFKRGFRGWQLLSPEEVDKSAKNIQRLLKGEQITGTEYTLRRLDGSVFPAIVISSVIYSDGNPVGIRGAIVDITERRQQEEELRRANAFLGSIVENIPNMIFLKDARELRFVRLNRAGEDLLGHSRDDMLGKDDYDFFPKEQADFFTEKDREVLRRKEIVNIPEEPLQTRNKGERILHTKKVPILDEKGEPEYLLGISEDITERKEAEKALKEAIDIINKSSSVAFTWKNQKGWPVEFVSENVESLFGYTAKEFMTGKVNYTDCVHPEDLQRVSKEVAEYSSKEETAGFIHEPYRIIAKDGSEKIITDWTYIVRDNDGRITHYKGIVEDITDRKRVEEEREKLQDQLQQAQKMEAIGTLAGGIAHDFNNILGAIIGYTEIADLQVPGDSKAKDSLKEVLKAGRRARDLVKQILAFSRKGEQERIPIQIGPIVKEALKLIRSSLPTTIEIRQNIESDTGIVEANPTQIHQILMNLCTNASHAMREKGGILEVGIRNVEIGSWDSEFGRFDRPPGNYLKLTVSDTGKGIAPEVLERIFEPYFTTKEKGEGTGLGLSVVHGIVKNYDGTITAYSELGKGTTFHVYLPVIQERGEVPEIDEVVPIPTGNEHILFIDDEPALVEIGKQMLERLGYKVTTRTSSMEALELFKAKPDQFDLVITDMTMPHMTGERLAGELINICSDIPVIICTGYSERISKEKAGERGIKAFVMKPLLMRDLAKTVREVLG